MPEKNVIVRMFVWPQRRRESGLTNCDGEAQQHSEQRAAGHQLGGEDEEVAPAISAKTSMPAEHDGFRAATERQRAADEDRGRACRRPERTPPARRAPSSTMQASEQRRDHASPASASNSGVGEKSPRHARSGAAISSAVDDHQREVRSASRDRRRRSELSCDWRRLAP